MRCSICGQKECCGAELEPELEKAQARIAELEEVIREYIAAEEAIPSFGEATTEQANRHSRAYVALEAALKED